MANDTQNRPPAQGNDQDAGAVERQAKLLEGVASADPGLSQYDFAGKLDSYVRFASIMAKAGDMIPPHMQGKVAMCMGIAMRAGQWRMDPYALAMETYQVKPGAPIAYMARVYMAVARQNAIKLRFRWEGEAAQKNEPTQGSRGGEVSKRSVTGTRKCIAFWTDEDGDVLEYETPEIRNIPIKNSPLWVNDPDQQLCYYAARGWMRRWRPELMMGAYSDDEVAAGRFARDVTPRDEDMSPLQRRAREVELQAQLAPVIENDDEEEVRPVAQPQRDPEEQARIDAQVQEAEVVDELGTLAPDLAPEHWTAAEPVNYDPMASAFDEGASAYSQGEPSSACPYLQGLPDADNWLAGWHGARRADA